MESIIVGLQTNEMFYSNKGSGCSNKAKKMYKKNQQQQQQQQNTSSPLSQDRSNLYLKNLCKYNNRNQDNLDINSSDYQKNEYLLNDTLKKQSISIDQIDKNDFDYQYHFKNNSKFEDEFKLDDLYRSKICRKNLESKIIDNNRECVRFSLDNVNFNTFNNIYNNNIKYYNRFDSSKSNPIKTIRQQSSSSSSKSINSNGNSCSSKRNSIIAINDQQSSNDSNKNSHLKKQKQQDNRENQIKIDNLSSSVV